MRNSAETPLAPFLWFPLIVTSWAFRKLTLTQYINLIGSFFLNSVQTDHSTCEGQSGPVWLLLLLLWTTIFLHLGDQPMPSGPQLKLEKPFRTLLESEPLLALPAWMLSQSSSLNFTPSLSVCVCYSGCLWHVYLLAPGCIPFAGLRFHLDSFRWACPCRLSARKGISYLLSLNDLSPPSSPSTPNAHRRQVLQGGGNPKEFACAGILKCQIFI